MFLALCIASVMAVLPAFRDGAVSETWMYGNILSYVFCLLPFLIGTAAYLSKTYPPGGQCSVSKVIGDCCLLLIQGGSLIGMAYWFTDADRFTSCFAGLCFSDLLWLLYDPKTHPEVFLKPGEVQAREGGRYAPRNWMLINFVFGLFSLIALLWPLSPQQLSWITLGLVILNRWADYRSTKFGMDD